MTFKFLVLVCLYFAVYSESNTCVNQCNAPYDGGASCQCDSLCDQAGNCCSDYHGEARCTGADTSCVNRCGETYSDGDTCHCDDQCSNAGNCCDDYDHICTGDDLSRVANEMWYGDWNAARESELTVNKQSFISDRNAHDDLSPDNLFTSVDSQLLSLKSYALFEALMNNYIAHTGNAEDVTSGELGEVDAFLQTIIATYPMQKAHEYLVSKGLASSDLQAFLEDLKKIWFEMYTRSSGPLDSSGFEHVLVGEIKNGDVTGFHNWIEFYLEEQTNSANYYGWLDDVEPDIMSIQFNWDGYMKEISSMWIGRSPEFELGIFTICFKEFPNKVCTFEMAGSTTNVQTYDQDVVYIGSAYPIA